MMMTPYTKSDVSYLHEFVYKVYSRKATYFHKMFSLIFQASVYLREWHVYKSNIGNLGYTNMLHPRMVHIEITCGLRIVCYVINPE